MVKYVYADVLFAINLLVNYLILLAAGKLSGREVRHWRLVVAGAAGGAYAVVSVLLPLSAAFSLPARLAFGLFMVAFSYPGRTAQSLIGVAFSFYLCSALAAGTAMALQNYRVATLVKGTVLPADSGAVRWWIVAASLAALCSLPVVTRLGGYQPGRPLPLLRLELSVSGRRLGLTGLVDTGNNLRDPVSNLPVVVVDWEPLRSVMPGEVYAFFSSTWESMPESLSRSPMGKRLRLIPYESLSGKKSVLPGFRPDHLVILGKGGHRVRKDAIIGVISERLSPNGLYQALLHPDLVNL
ncbi:MAG: sigma-E processing peptidase SpoIIGA [Bacillota bacterium]